MRGDRNGEKGGGTWGIEIWGGNKGELPMSTEDNRERRRASKMREGSDEGSGERQGERHSKQISDG